jgi:hypothetical protein
VRRGESATPDGFNQKRLPILEQRKQHAMDSKSRGHSPIEPDCDSREEKSNEKRDREMKKSRGDMNPV